LWLAALLVAPACNLYNLDLLGDAHGDDGPSGGNASGGNDNTGGGAEDGGANGSGGDTGGTETGGDTSAGGMNLGGDNSGGGSESGGGTGGGEDGGSGGGSGGSTPIVYVGMIDTFSDTTASYSKMPFYGTWARYAQDQDDSLFTAASVTAMMQPRPDDAANGAFHVAATMLDDWGVGVFVTLKNGSAVNLSDATGIRFNAISMNTETILKVALADINSHRNICTTVNSGADCDKHMRTVTSFALGATWAEVELPLSDFVDKVIDGVNDRTSDLDVTQVFAIHFQQDPDDEAVDFYLDDLEIY